MLTPYSFVVVKMKFPKFKTSRRKRERLFRDICARLGEKPLIYPYTGNEKEDFQVGWFSEPISTLYEFKPSDLEKRLVVVRGELRKEPNIHSAYEPENILGVHFGTNLPTEARESFSQIAKQNNTLFAGYGVRGCKGRTYAEFYLSRRISSFKDWKSDVDGFYNALCQIHQATTNRAIGGDNEQYAYLTLHSFHH